MGYLVVADTLDEMARKIAEVDNTLKIIDVVREFRNDTGIPLCFTLDAGPNVHLLYPDEHNAKIKDFIKDNLLQYCHDNQYIDDIVQKSSNL